MSDEEYSQEGINMQLKPIKDRIEALEKWKKIEEEQHQNITKSLDNFVIDAGAIGDSVYSNKLKSFEKEIAELRGKLKSFKEDEDALHELIRDQYAELKESIELLKRFQQGYIDRIINLEAVLRELFDRIIYISRVYESERHDNFLKELQDWRINLRGLVKKLDVARQTECLLNKPHASSVRIERKLAEKCQCPIHKKTEKKERCEFCNGSGFFETEGLKLIDCVHCEGTGLAEDSGGNGIDETKICPKCGAYYKGTHTSTECAYHSGEEASGGEKTVEENYKKQDKDWEIKRDLGDLDSKLPETKTEKKDIICTDHLESSLIRLSGGEKEMVKKGIGDDSYVDKPEPIRLSSNEKVLEVKEGIPSIHSKLHELTKITSNCNNFQKKPDIVCYNGRCPHCEAWKPKTEKEDICKLCVYKNNFDDNTCGGCKPNSPQSRFSLKDSWMEDKVIGSIGDKMLVERTSFTITKKKTLFSKPKKIWIDKKDLIEKKEVCKHKNTSSSSDPLIWYICHDCGAHLNQRFEVIPKEYHGIVNEVLEASGGEKDNSGVEVPNRQKGNIPQIKPDSKLPEYVCTLKEQNDCDQEGSMECLKGNSEGVRLDSDVCVHGKKELEGRIK